MTLDDWSKFLLQRFWRFGLSKIALIAGEEIGWSHPRFLPDDPLEIVFWAHQDGLDANFATKRLEQKFRVKFSEEEFRFLKHARMSDLVDTIRKKEAH